MALIRGFKADDDFLGKFRINPGPCLLKFMAERSASFDYERFRGHMMRLKSHELELTRAGMFIPGYMKQDRNYWLFPLVVENKDLFI